VLIRGFGLFGLITVA